MADVTRLELQLTGRPLRPEPGERSWNVHRGGPEALLRWLETQLGLQFAPPPYATRILEFAAALDRMPGPSFADSLTADRWGTASELLGRRDALRLAGWDGRSSPGLPTLLNDLARAAEHTPLRWPDQAERLARVMIALDEGQRLPPHRIILLDPPDLWPLRWQQILARLATGSPPACPPSASRGTALRTIQDQLIEGTLLPAGTDPSLRWLRSRSAVAACEAIALALAAEPAGLTDTVICCEDPTVALALDGCLGRLGLPSVGASLLSLAHPVLQVLPLALRLCWEPVDPALLLDFLALPVGPIPARAARRLAEALAGQPGLGSHAWEAAIEALCAPQADPEGRLRERLRTWLVIGRRPWGSPLPAALVKERCARVAQWASGRARALAEAAASEAALSEALQAAAGQATTLGALVETQGSDLSEPQLARLLEATLPQGITAQPHLEAADGPRLVTSFAEIVAPCARLIWLGLGTADPPTPAWTAQEFHALRSAGIDLDDGSRALAARREAERRGLARVTEALLTVALPADEELRPHPIWLQIKGALARGMLDHPVDVESVLTGTHPGDVGPWRFAQDAFALRPAQPMRPRWSVPPGLLQDRASTSASDLTCRLGCPLQWVFRYAARLEPGAMVSLPDDFLLKGTFGHLVLQAVRRTDGTVLPPDAAEQAVLRRFDERLPLDAAPLAQPARLEERLRLRSELAAAARSLASVLHAGGYRIEGFEVPIQGTALGRTLLGFIDCLLTRQDGEEGVIDFKYAGRERYRRLLEEGRAVQLATYAQARMRAAAGRPPGVGYLILADGLLYTPEGSPLRGAGPGQVIPGPAIGVVWDRLAAAVTRADGWLTAGEAVPARPLQDPAEWPEGAALAIDTDPSKDRSEREPCMYCDYQALCGLAELL
jgi:ATP-dependent helicase/nuclease subunit B